MQYQPWQFKNDKVPQSYWIQEEHRIKALKYVFEVELRCSLDDIKEKLSWEVIKEQGLYRLKLYYISIYKVANSVYPSKIKPCA